MSLESLTVLLDIALLALATFSVVVAVRSFGPKGPRHRQIAPLACAHAGT